MISLITKYWKFILDIIIVIAIVVFVFLWNPGSIFGDGLKLQSTANHVSNIRSIGQLVTAEYYGEVMATLDDATINLIEEDVLSDSAHDVFIDLKAAMLEIYNLDTLKRKDREVPSDFTGNNKKRKQIFKQEARLNNILEKTKYYYGEGWNGNFMSFILEHLRVNRFGQKEKLKKGRTSLKQKHKQEALFRLYREVVRHHRAGFNVFNDYLIAGFETKVNFTDFYNGLQVEKLDKQKKELALIGRGWVKAGFDFNTLDERNFSYDETKQIIHLFGMAPRILDADINPWFIPQRKIPGYDVLFASKSTDFDDLITVKKQCIRELEQMAEEADIIKSAERYGEESFKAFFSLLTGDEIKEVRFHRDELKRIFELISRDSVITSDELDLINNTISNHWKEVQKEKDEILRNRKKDRLSWFVGDLKTLRIRYSHGTKTITSEFNYFTRSIPAIVVDSLITKEELRTLDTLRWGYPTALDTTKMIWFEDSLSYVEDYNQFIINLTESGLEKVYTLKHDTLNISSSSPAYSQKLSSLSDSLGLYQDRIASFNAYGNLIVWSKIDSIVPFDFSSYYYNINADNEAIENYIFGNLKTLYFSADIMRGKVPTKQQKKEYLRFVEDVKERKERYETKSQFIRTSERIRRDYLNKDKISETTQAWRKDIKSFGESFK